MDTHHIYSSDIEIHYSHVYTYHIHTIYTDIIYYIHAYNTSITYMLHTQIVTLHIHTHSICMLFTQTQIITLTIHIYTCYIYATHINSDVASHIYASTHYILHSHTYHIQT